MPESIEHLNKTDPDMESVKTEVLRFLKSQPKDKAFNRDEILEDLFVDSSKFIFTSSSAKILSIALNKLVEDKLIISKMNKDQNDFYYINLK